MAIKRRVVDGERVLVATTETAFAEAMDVAMRTGEAIEAPEELGRRFGFPGADEDVGDVEDLEASSHGPGSAHLLPGAAA